MNMREGWEKDRCQGSVIKGRQPRSYRHRGAGGRRDGEREGAGAPVPGA